MALSNHDFGKHVYNLKVGGMRKKKNTIIHSFSNRWTVHIYILCTLMKNCVGNNLNSTKIISMERSKVILRKSKVNQESSKQIISKHIADIAQYLDLVEDFETRTSFFYFSKKLENHQKTCTSR